MHLQLLGIPNKVYGSRFFLPPIILYAGLSVRKKAFFQFLPTSATLGILGTYIAFAVIALLLYAMSRPLGITLAVRACHSPTPTHRLQAQPLERLTSSRRRRACASCFFPRPLMGTGCIQKHTVMADMS